MKSIFVFISCLLFTLASSVLSIDVNSVCYINSGMGETKNLRVKYEPIYLERVDLTAIKTGEIHHITTEI